jgi:glucan phosphorylase
MLPRQLQIILEINRRFLDTVRHRFLGDEGRVQRVSLVERVPSARFAWPIWRSSARTAPTESPPYTRACYARRR